MSDIGPALPPHLLAKRKRQQEEAEKAASEAAAAAAAKDGGLKESEGKRLRDEAATTPAENDVDDKPEKRRRVIGPYMPAPVDQMPSRGPDEDDHQRDEEDESSDDDIGPSLPGASTSSVDEEVAAQRRLATHNRPREEKLTRDEWMMVPPEQGDWASRADPTKIRNRKFQTGKGAKAPMAKGGDNSLWTETAADKAKRVADEVMGVRKPATQSGVDEDPKVKAARLEAEDTQRRIDDYNVSAPIKSAIRTASQTETSDQDA
ncbi:hypothetical protein AA313_de0200767 [Arthrobotrys entomopaga]|nr:hypothetical protein AA313_de0200767 [Arthrobotrys entomopaga]